jgi:hypothetical protein
MFRKRGFGAFQVWAVYWLNGSYQTEKAEGFDNELAAIERYEQLKEQLATASRGVGQIARVYGVYKRRHHPSGFSEIWPLAPWNREKRNKEIALLGRTGVVVAPCATEDAQA